MFCKSHAKIDLSRRKYGVGIDIWALGIVVMELVDNEPPLMHLAGIPAMFAIAKLQTRPLCKREQQMSRYELETSHYVKGRGCLPRHSISLINSCITYWLSTGCPVKCSFVRTKSSANVFTLVCHIQLYSSFFWISITFPWDVGKFFDNDFQSKGVSKKRTFVLKKKI